MIEIKHKETKITVVHNISVDSCIAEEIEKLNNENNIFTLSSCCGHGGTGYIIVAGDDIQPMISLGYEMVAPNYLDNELESEKGRIVICGFKPKSTCHCTET